MKLYNKSARPHWLGNVLIAPLATEEVGEEWRGAYNTNDLEEVVEKATVEAVEATEEVTEESTDNETQPRRTRAKKEI